MDESADGIVLRTHPLTETSLIVHWLTAQHGRVATVAKGARRPTSPFRGKLDLFYAASFSFVRSRRSELHTLREVAVKDSHPLLRREIGWLQQAAYAAALIEQATETDTPLEDVYWLFSEFVNHLPARPKTPRTVFAFEAKLLALSGLAPDWFSKDLSPGSKKLLSGFETFKWPALQSLECSEPQQHEINALLARILTMSLGRLLPKRAPAISLP